MAARCLNDPIEPVIAVPGVVTVARFRHTPVLNVVSTAALHHIFMPHVSDGSMLSKKHLSESPNDDS
jgi:hypothetical protein